MAVVFKIENFPALSIIDIAKLALAFDD